MDCVSRRIATTEETRNEQDELVRQEQHEETPLERLTRLVEEGEVRFDWGD